MKVNSREIAAIACKALDEKKAENVKVIEISNISSVADYFIIANGTNTPHVDALVDNVSEELSKAGYKTERVEGKTGSGWILMDYNDVVIHIFSKEDRLFYDLERIWRDGKPVDVTDLIKETK